MAIALNFGRSSNRQWLSLVLAAALCASGCSGGDEKPATEAPAGDGATSSNATSSGSGVSMLQPNNSGEASPTQGVAARIPQDATPNQITELYFNAVAADDIGLAEQLLTGSARQAFGSLKIQPSMPAPANSTFRIGEARFATNRKEIAWVETFWSTPVEGAKVEYTAEICLKANDAGQWRISGMMMADPDAAPIFFDFEDYAALKAIHSEVGGDGSADNTVREADAGGNPIR